MKKDNNNLLGFYATDGSFQHLSSINTTNLEFAGKSRLELEKLLQENIDLERYEKCAIIRDELIRRSNA